MNPLHQPTPHRVYLHASNFCDRWFVQYLEADLKTPIGRLYSYNRIEQVREILHSADCSSDERAKFEEGLSMLGFAACFLSLTDEQYGKLTR